MLVRTPDASTDVVIRWQILAQPELQRFASSGGAGR